jgi:hypothetical protein
MNLLLIILSLLLIYFLFKLDNNESFTENTNPYILTIPINNISPSNITPSNMILSNNNAYNLYIVYNNEKYIFIPFDLLKNEYQTLIINNKPTIINKINYYNVYNYYNYNKNNNNFVNIYNNNNEINILYLIKLDDLSTYTNITDYLNNDISKIYIINNELKINDIAISYNYLNILFLSNMGKNKLLVDNNNQFINNVSIINIYSSINIYTININY